MPTWKLIPLSMLTSASIVGGLDLVFTWALNR
jgi:hypothetical protein